VDSHWLSSEERVGGDAVTQIVLVCRGGSAQIPPQAARFFRARAGGPYEAAGMNSTLGVSPEIRHSRNAATMPGE